MRSLEYALICGHVYLLQTYKNVRYQYYRFPLRMYIALPYIDKINPNLTKKVNLNFEVRGSLQRQKNNF